MKLAELEVSGGEDSRMTTTNPEFPDEADSPSFDAKNLGQRLRASFRESPYHELRRLECDACDGALTVRGQLSSYYLKQLAVCLVQRADGNVPIRIAIDVS
jgi:hypothetical protein